MWLRFCMYNHLHILCYKANEMMVYIVNFGILNLTKSNMF